MKHIFVFGSNLAGFHGAGSAAHAVEHHGAILGKGVGYQGNSYAIPTKNSRLKTLPLDVIKKYVETFLADARISQDITFDIVAIGCGLAGYEPKDIAPLFKGAPPNCNLPEEFETILEEIE